MDAVRQPLVIVLLTLYGWCTAMGGASSFASSLLTYGSILPGRPSAILHHNLTTSSPSSFILPRTGGVGRGRGVEGGGGRGGGKGGRELMEGLPSGGALVPAHTLPSTTTSSTGAFTPPARFNNQLLPSFANTTETNVTVIRDKTAYLHCHVLNLGTKTVSWVRHEDIHVLTVGRLTFTNDDRFVAMNKPGSDVWSLMIKFPQLRDSGKYECQVSTRPLRAKVVQLNVVEPQAVIPPAPELYVDYGSPLNITCVVPDSPEPPEHLFWYHRDKMVSWDGSRDGVTISTTKGRVTTSTLFIPDVTTEDSGIYICAPQGMREASVAVSVLSGERTQAMQTGSTCRGCVGSIVLLVVSVVYHLLG